MLMKMNEEKKSKEFLERRPPAKKPLGRPMKRWIEGFDEQGAAMKGARDTAPPKISFIGTPNISSAEY